MMRSIIKEIKNIIWYSSYYDFEGNCIVRNRRIDLIDWDIIKEVIGDIIYFLVCYIISIICYFITPYIIAYLICNIHS